MNTQITSPKSICILRLSAIGDVCHAISAVQAIQNQWPNAQLTWVIGKVEAQLLSSFPNIHFVIFDKKAGLQAYKSLWFEMKHIKFDVLLHMQVALRASIATLCIRATEKWGFDKKRAKEGQWLFTNKKIEPQSQPHVVDGFWGFAKAIGVPENLKPVWRMPINDKDITWCTEQTQSRDYIVISPSASKEERNWLPERYAAVADFAYQQGFSVVLSGGPSSLEQRLGESIIKECNSPIINLIGQSSLSQLLALLDRATLLIAPDSGPAHMATTVKTPVIGLYAHSNPKRTGPYDSQHTTISVYEKFLLQQTGKSISKNPWGKRVKGPDLMQSISIESVTEMMQQLIDDK